MIGYSVYRVVKPRPEIRPSFVFVRYYVHRDVENSPARKESHRPAVTKTLTQDKSEEENTEDRDRMKTFGHDDQRLKAEEKVKYDEYVGQDRSRHDIDRLYVRFQFFIQKAVEPVGQKTVVVG